MAKMRKGWKSDEFRTPDIIWFVRLEGKYWEPSRKKWAKLSGTAVKLTYICLARYLDIYGEVFPAIETVAKLTEQSEKNAQRCINYLVEVGLIRKINRRTDENMKTSNEYILMHPSQVEGLEVIKVRESTKFFESDAASQRTDAASQPKNMDFDGNLAESGTDAASYPKNLRGSENPSNFGTDAASQRTDATTYDGQSVGSSVGGYAAGDHARITEKFRKAFQEELDEFQLEEIMDFEIPVERVLKLITLIRNHVPIRSGAFQVLASALAAERKGAPWEFHEDAGQTKPRRSWNSRGSNRETVKSTPDNLKSKREEAAAMEEEPPMNQEEISAKLKLMKERFELRRQREQLR